MSTEIRPGDTWRAIDPDRLQCLPTIQVIGFAPGGMVRIERFYPRNQRARKDEITPAGLRRHYELVLIQSALPI